MAPEGWFPLLLFQLVHSSNISRLYRGGTLAMWPTVYSRSMILPSRMVHDYQEVPVNFDARTNWPECPSIRRIKAQGSCGTCWAFAVANVMSDRVCIASGGKNKFEYSAQDLVTCCDKCFFHIGTDTRCSAGSFPGIAMEYLVENGAVSKECKPYNPMLLGEQECERECLNEWYKVPYRKDKKNIDSMGYEHRRFLAFDLRTVQIEIMTGGPVVAILTVGDHFRKHAGNGKVYISPFGYFNQDENMERHAVRVVGWGVQESLPYWLVANSWGNTWGKMGGFFRIVRGTNELGIEDSFLTGYIKGSAASSRISNVVVTTLIICVLIRFIFDNTLFH